jgi:hypothetical protein
MATSAIRRFSLTAPCACTLALLATGVASASTPLRKHVRGPDFDLDGYADLAISAGDSPIGSPAHSGQVFLWWGGPDGLEIDPGKGELLWQDGPGVAGTSAANDGFGRALAWGDFDGDCYDDLVVGVPGKDIGGATSAGAIHIFYGGSAGLSGAAEATLHRGSIGMDGTYAAHDGFGRELEVGDFNGDDYDDIAVGTKRIIDGLEGAGDVHIIYGSPIGLDPAGTPDDRVLVPGSGGFAGAPSAYDYFGASLAAGDFDCDGRDDLAIAEYDEIGLLVHVIHGGSSGLDGRRGVQLWSDRNVPVGGDWLGGNLATGNFNGDSAADPDGDYVANVCSDLAIGFPGNAVGGVPQQGFVIVMYGHPYDAATPGLDIVDPTPSYFDQTTGAIPPATSPADNHFGASLGIGQLDANSASVFDDLLVSLAPGVVALRGAPGGLTDVGSVRWTRDTPGIPGVHADDRPFGGDIAFGDYDGDGAGNVAITAADDDPAMLGLQNDLTILDLDDTSPPTIVDIDAWLADDFSWQAPESFEYFGLEVTKGRSTWPIWWCG